MSPRLVDKGNGMSARSHVMAGDLFTLAAAALDCAGTAEFTDAFVDWVRGAAGCDFCSAFLADDQRQRRYLLAGGQHPRIPGFAETASLDYAQRYWQRDRVTQQVLASGGDAHAVHVVRQAWNTITDPEYRRACYERANVLERITVYATRKPRVFASAYWSRDSGPASAEGAERLETIAPLLIAVLVKHVELSKGAIAGSLFPPLHDVVARLSQAGFSLSRREVEVLAGLLLRRTQSEISQTTGVALSSIITYRRRAYRKLGVADQRELERLYNQLSRP